MNIYLMKKPKRINSVSVTVTLVVLAIGYLLWFVIPTYWPSFQMGGIMKGACHDAYRIINNEKLMKKLLEDSRRTGLRITRENFKLTRVPYTAEDRANKNIPSGSYPDKRGKACQLEFYYEDDFPWPLIGKTTRITFHKFVETPLEQVKYDDGIGQDCTCVSTR